MIGTKKSRRRRAPLILFFAATYFLAHCCASVHGSSLRGQANDVVESESSSAAEGIPEDRSLQIDVDKETGVELDAERDGIYALSSNDPVAEVKTDGLTVDPNDYIMRKGAWDGAPIVVQQFKLIFFTLPMNNGATFKMLFRRMMGYKDWRTLEPHDPKHNGLKYLYDYSPEEATMMMTSDEWTRALFVTNPKLRALSAYVEKGMAHGGAILRKKCCPINGECQELGSESFRGFLQVVARCKNPHWDPQSDRMEGKYWPYINFVGHSENVSTATISLLRKIGAWEDYGADGWGEGHDEHIFAHGHSILPSKELVKHFASPKVEATVEKLYQKDYDNKLFGFRKSKFGDLVRPDATKKGGIGVETKGDCGPTAEEKIPLHKPKQIFIIPNHYIYSNAQWDSAPIVVEKYKLMFFSVPDVACTLFKKLLRKMMGLNDWEVKNKHLPHDPNKNGLKYLYDYSPNEATTFLISDEWTKAIFVRDPKERVVSSYVNRGLQKDADFVKRRCCSEKGVCAKRAGQSFMGFLQVIQKCCNPQWNPVTHRMEGRYWPYINFVGQLNNAAKDVKAMLEKVGAWEEHGKTGWGESKQEAVLAKGGSSVEMERLMKEYLTEESEALVEKIYGIDYRNRMLKFKNTKIASPQRRLSSVDDMTLPGHDETRRRLLHRDHVDPAELGVETPRTGRFGHSTSIALEEDEHLEVKKTDIIYKHQSSWQGAPVVIEKYKLIFFLQRRVASRTFRKLLRRMMGYENWLNGPSLDPATNGLKYFFNYTVEEVQDMMLSDDWTKAIFVRNPKQRILSAFLEKGVNHNGDYMKKMCCPKEGKCVEMARSSLEGFLQVSEVCENPYWNPQSWRMEGKYWPFMDIIGHIEFAAEDTETMLRKVGAWDEFGTTGWGKKGDEHIFPDGFETKAWQHWSEHYNEETEKLVESIFAEDYDNPFLGMDAAIGDFLEETEDTFDFEEESVVEVTGTCGGGLPEPIPDWQDDAVTVGEEDYIYKKGHWDGAPIVIEDKKLLFFTVPGVAATTFKQLLRRMTGLDNWRESNENVPHDPRYNGLKYLWDYSIEEATNMMVEKKHLRDGGEEDDEEWIRAVFARDPKERVLTSYLNFVVHGNGKFIRRKCCNDKGACVDKARNFTGYLEIIDKCCNPHWFPQTQRMEARYWPSINFVGRIERAAEDIETLLRSVQAWDEYGATGWGETGDERIFENFSDEITAVAQEVMSKYYDAESEARVEKMYASDYENSILDLQLKKVMLSDEGEQDLGRRRLQEAPAGERGMNVEEARSFIRSLVGEENYQRMVERSSRDLGQTLDYGVETTHEGEFGKQVDEPIPDSPTDHLVIEPDHSIIDAHQWDQAPVVLTKYKMLFFTQRKVASQTWKRLFRRMMGYDDWKTGEVASLHDNGLKYLFEYSIGAAEKMMVSKEWVRAIFVRDPKERILSAYLDQGVGNDGAYMLKRCCPVEGACVQESSTFEGFLNVASVCENPAWIPQSWRMEGRYWPFMTYVGKLENAAEDSKELLQSIGAWEEFGHKGWGKYGNDPVFPAGYVTQAWQHWTEYYNDDTEKMVEQMYAEDYENPYLPYVRSEDDFVETAAEDLLDDGDEGGDVASGEEPDGDEEEDLGVENFKACGAKVIEEIPETRPDDAALDPNFYVYKRGPWDGAPIVLEDAKLVFFAVPEIASSTFKKLFRRMMGFDDWQESNSEVPHNPSTNGLRYLYDYSLEEASNILVSDEWMRAIFVRDPKERILDSYLIRVLGSEAEFIQRKCCKDNGLCADKAMESFLGFMKVARACCNSHWMPQSRRMEARFWRFINFVGHIDYAAQDVKHMLELLDKWDEFGASGWGEEGDEAIFGGDVEEKKAKFQELLANYYDEETEAFAEELYAEDYDNPVLELELTKIMQSHNAEDNGRRMKMNNQLARGTGEKDLEIAREFIRELVSVEEYGEMAAKKDKVRNGEDKPIIHTKTGMLQQKTASEDTVEDISMQRTERSLEEHPVLEHVRFRTKMGVEKRNMETGARVKEPINMKPGRTELETGHYVMGKWGWDASPVVVEEFKLIFFTIPKVGCTVFKQLFRRMRGFDDWADVTDRVPHDVEHNGLNLLSTYPVDKASEMLANPDWTKAIFLREPKDRLLSAFLDKVVSRRERFIHRHCCPNNEVCVGSVADSFESFIWMTTQCRDPHWIPQTWRMEGRHWAHINFVGHLASVADDTKALLTKIGAWEKYGKSGWGKSKEDPIFTSHAVPHQTGAKSHLEEYFTAEIERLVENLYQEDYNHPLFNFTVPKINFVDQAKERCARSVAAIEQTHEENFPVASSKPAESVTEFVVDGSDYAYRHGLMDGAPIVVEEFNLIFFATPEIGSTTFKKLFRRMMGYSDWHKRNKQLPHEPSLNGLRYLWDMSKHRAARILSSDDWTKAIFVRDPKERLLSAFLSRSPHDTARYLRERCCPSKRECASDKLSLDEFLEVAANCRDGLWLPQSQRMESQYWPHINFVGHFETVHQDTKALLTRIGAWEEFGKTGWGHKDEIFSSDQQIPADLRSIFYTPEIEKRVEEVYGMDYKHTTLNLTAK